MTLILAFYKKNGKAEMTETPDYAGPIPRLKENIYCDEDHKGIVFNVLYNFSRKEVIIKVR